MSGGAPAYVELQVTTHFSFLRGASSPDELFAAASLLGLPALGIVDRHSVAGIVRAWDAEKTTGVRAIVGARLDLVDGTALLVYPTDKVAYGRMCRLLSVGKGRAGKGACHLDWPDVEEWNEGLIACLVPDRADATNEAALERTRRVFGNRAYMALSIRRRPRDAIRLRDLAAQAAAARVPTVATGDVLYHAPERRLLQDVVTCIREKCTIDDLGDRRERFADRHLKSPAEMERLFRRYLKDSSPVARAAEFAARCTFSLEELRYQYPDEIRVPGRTPQQELERLTWKKAPERYPDGLDGKVRTQLEHELKLIGQLDYAPYFLTVHSIVAEARRREILCQGRGSAANSAVCYVLGITSIDPVRSELLFERFVSAERREPPDIDVDFEHERREEIIQWIYETYEREFAEKTFKQIEGFGSYGFPESHAASFALIAYASSWMKCHHPDAFCAALLNAQPMGFYAPAQIVRDARQHGVEVRPIDVNKSRWDCTLEDSDAHGGAGKYLAVRLGLRMIRGLANEDGAAIVSARGDQPFMSVEEIQRRAGVGRGALDRIGDADGFASLACSRREGLWDVKGLGNAALPLFAAADERDRQIRREAIEPLVPLAPMGEGAEVVEDYRASGLSLRAHPLAFLRDELRARKMISCQELQTVKDGRWIELAGVVLVRQKPGSAKGVMFITLEDETNVANLVVWTKVFEANRRTVLGASMMGVRGQVQREGEVIHVIAQRLDDLSPLLASIGNRADIADVYRVSRADVVKSPVGRDPRDPAEQTLGRNPRDIYIPDLRLGSGIVPDQPTAGIKIKPRDFR